MKMVTLLREEGCQSREKWARQTTQKKERDAVSSTIVDRCDQEEEDQRERLKGEGEGKVRFWVGT